MGIEYFFGRRLLGSETAFTDRLVFIENPYKEVGVDTIFNIQTFCQKKDAKEFCDRWGLKPESILMVKTRFQSAWAINMHSHEFLPCHAQGHLIAASLGRTLLRVDTSSYEDGGFE
ncbi:MAG: hypothetical protein ACRC8W_02995 [Plesiomonas shigelloides]